MKCWLWECQIERLLCCTYGGRPFQKSSQLCTGGVFSDVIMWGLNSESEDEVLSCLIEYKVQMLGKITPGMIIGAILVSHGSCPCASIVTAFASPPKGRMREVESTYNNIYSLLYSFLGLGVPARTPVFLIIVSYTLERDITEGVSKETQYGICVLENTEAIRRLKK